MDIKNVLFKLSEGCSLGNITEARDKAFNLLKNLGLIFKPFLISVMQRLNEIEMSLKAKGYQE